MVFFLAHSRCLNAIEETPEVPNEGDDDEEDCGWNDQDGYVLGDRMP